MNFKNNSKLNVAIWSFYADVVNRFNCINHGPKDIRENGYMRMDKLAESLVNSGHTVKTLDNYTDPSKIDVFITFDSPSSRRFPYAKHIINSKKILKLLIISECEMIRPGNFSPNIKKIYDHIFTWDDDSIDNLQYIKANTNFLETRWVEPTLKNNKFVMIASNKTAWHPNELYSTRVEIIEWFENNSKDDFDLYGSGWDNFAFPNNIRPWTYLNNERFKWIQKLLYKKRKSWLGVVPTKKEVMSQYRFSFAIENACGYKGYILEKIFDPFFSGSIPIYKGAENITEHIPAECFISLDNFDSISDVVKYCKSLPSNKVLEYLDNTNNFLSSSAADQFCADYLVKEVNEVIDKFILTRIVNF
jgi:hypothetical protein